MIKLINPKYRHPETGKEGEEKKETKAKKNKNNCFIVSQLRIYFFG